MRTSVGTEFVFRWDGESYPMSYVIERRDLDTLTVSPDVQRAKDIPGAMRNIGGENFFLPRVCIYIRRDDLGKESIIGGQNSTEVALRQGVRVHECVIIDGIPEGKIENVIIRLLNNVAKDVKQREDFIQSIHAMDPDAFNFHGVVVTNGWTIVPKKRRGAAHWNEIADTSSLMKLVKNDPIHGLDIFAATLELIGYLWNEVQDAGNVYTITAVFHFIKQAMNMSQVRGAPLSIKEMYLLIRKDARTPKEWRDDAKQQGRHPSEIGRWISDRLVEIYVHELSS